MLKNPFISVVVAAYCAETTLHRAVASLQEQANTSWEAIIVDDQSDDNTFQIAQCLAKHDLRIRTFQLEKNSGPAAARNFGISQARGEWIAVLDADDAFAPNRFEVFLKFIKFNNFDLVFDNIAELGSLELKPISYWSHWKNKDPEITLLEMLKGCSGVYGKGYGLMKPFFKRKLFHSKKIMYDETLMKGEDVHFYLSLMLSKIKTARINQIGYYYKAPDKQDKSHASMNNLEHSYLATKKIKDKWWKKMSVAERFWISVRLAKSLESNSWNRFIQLKKEPGVKVELIQLVFSRRVAYKILVGSIPVKTYKALLKIKEVFFKAILRRKA